MDERLKQRLVGATVLVFLAAVFVPMILEGPQDPQPEVEGRLAAPKPEKGFSSRIIPLEKPRTAAETGTVKELPGPGAPTAAMTKERFRESSPPAVSEAPGDEASLPAQAPQAGKSVQPAGDAGAAPASTARRVGLSAWAVQLGSFAKAKNAIALRDRLRAAGYTSFVESAYSDKGTVTRVFVGPELEKREADQVLRKLKMEMKLQEGLVVRYPRG